MPNGDPPIAGPVGAAAESYSMDGYLPVKLSVRDEFAKEAMRLCASDIEGINIEYASEVLAAFARKCYIIADALMAERQRSGEQGFR